MQGNSAPPPASKNYATEKELWSAKPDGFEPLALALGFGAKTVGVSGKDGTVRLFDGKTGKETAVLKGHKGPVSAVAFSPTGEALATGGEDGTVRVWETTTGREAAALKGHTGPVKVVALGPDGARLASGSAEKTIRVWELKK